MRITIDRSKCADHGQCIFSAPDVFRWGDDGELAFDEQPAEDLRADVELAVDSCPVQALVLHD